MERKVASVAALAARRRAQAHFRQATGAEPARKGLAGRRIAKVRTPSSRSGSRACAFLRLIAQFALRAAPRGTADHRVARERRPTTKYWLSTLPEDIPFDKLVDAVKLRWRIERDYQEFKQEVGLGHYEGRGWRGFHHHATLCIAAYGFLIAERETIPL